MDIKVISFDLDKTIIDTPHPAEIIRLYLRKNGIKANKNRILDILKKVNIQREIVDPEKYYILINHEILKKFGLTELKYAKELLRFWFSPINYSLFPDVKITLEKLSEKYELVIISNNLSWEINQVLKHTSLSKYFKNVFSPDITNSFKPSIEVFKYVSNTLKFNLHNLLHIGDSLEEDYEAAIKAGAQALLIKRYLGVKESYILKKKRIPYITSLTQLLEMI